MAFMATILKTYPQQYEGSVKINQQMNNAVVEYVNGIEVIKAFNQSAASYGKYSDAVRENASYFYNWMKSCQWAMASYNAICPAVLITVLPAGVLFYAAGSITAANLITIIILSLGIVGPLIAASNFADSLGAVGTVVGEIATLLDGPELVRPVEPVKLDGEEICLHDVSFSYKENGDNAISHNEHGNIKKSIGLGLLNAIFHALQLYAIFAVLAALVNGNPDKNTALIAVGLMLVSIVGKIVTQYYSQLQRVHAGYFMAADKRIQIGDKLKVVPMGYFNQNSLGNITAVATTTLSEVETTAPVVLVTTLGGFINAVVFAICWSIKNCIPCPCPAVKSSG